MKQILQNLKSGDTLLANIPEPNRVSGHLLIQSKCSLISIGTEKMLIDFGKASLFEKLKTTDKVTGSC